MNSQSRYYVGRSGLRMTRDGTFAEAQKDLDTYGPGGYGDLEIVRRLRVSECGYQYHVVRDGYWIQQSDADRIADGDEPIYPQLDQFDPDTEGHK